MKPGGNPHDMQVKDLSSTSNKGRCEVPMLMQKVFTEKWATEKTVHDQKFCTDAVVRM